MQGLGAAGAAHGTSDSASKKVSVLSTNNHDPYCEALLNNQSEPVDVYSHLVNLTRLAVREINPTYQNDNVVCSSISSFRQLFQHELLTSDTVAAGTIIRSAIGL